jgi:hypothetical protein
MELEFREGRQEKRDGEEQRRDEERMRAVRKEDCMRDEQGEMK